MLKKYSNNNKILIVYVNHALLGFLPVCLNDIYIIGLMIHS